MNKLNTDPKKLKLYSYDYEYIQDQAEIEAQKFLRQTIVTPYAQSILRGFDLNISSLDNTKLKVNHTSTGNAITYDGTVIESTDTIDLIELSDYTIFAGENNTGKTSLIRAIMKHTDLIDYEKIHIPAENIKPNNIKNRNSM